jgi:hypothetical protein
MTLDSDRQRKAPQILSLAILIVLGSILVYRGTSDSTKRIDEPAEEAQILIPTTGTSSPKIAALSIGMMAHEVEPILGLPYNLGIEIFPFNYKYNGSNWVSNELPIKDVGYVQAVFIEKRLVGLGSLDPHVGRLCGNCLMDIIDGIRPFLDGLPNQVQGICPTCESNKAVPFGATFHASDPFYIDAKGPAAQLER